MAGEVICNRNPRMLPEGGRVVHSLGMTAVSVTQRYLSLCRIMLADRHVCKGGMVPKTRGQRIHAYSFG